MTIVRTRIYTGSMKPTRVESAPDVRDFEWASLGGKVILPRGSPGRTDDRSNDLTYWSWNGEMGKRKSAPTMNQMQIVSKRRPDAGKNDFQTLTEQCERGQKVELDCNIGYDVYKDTWWHFVIATEEFISEMSAGVGL